MPISSPRSPRTVSGLTSPHPRYAPGDVQTRDVQLVFHSEPAPPPGTAGPRQRELRQTRPLNGVGTTGSLEGASRTVWFSRAPCTYWEKRRLVIRMGQG